LLRSRPKARWSSSCPSSWIRLCENDELLSIMHWLFQALEYSNQKVKFGKSVGPPLLARTGVLASHPQKFSSSWDPTTTKLLDHSQH
jgi:hypothetical protein